MNASAVISTTNTRLWRQPPRALLPQSGFGTALMQSPRLRFSGMKSLSAIVVAGEDNAATELIEEGVNGFVAPSASPRDLADAIVRVWEGGPELRRSTAEWFGRNAERLSLEHSMTTVLEAYSSARS